MLQCQVWVACYLPMSHTSLCLQRAYCGSVTFRPALHHHRVRAQLISVDHRYYRLRNPSLTFNYNYPRVSFISMHTTLRMEEQKDKKPVLYTFNRRTTTTPQVESSNSTRTTQSASTKGWAEKGLTMLKRLANLLTNSQDSHTETAFTSNNISFYLPQKRKKELDTQVNTPSVAEREFIERNIWLQSILKATVKVEDIEQKPENEQTRILQNLIKSLNYSDAQKIAMLLASSPEKILGMGPHLAGVVLHALVVGGEYSKAMEVIRIREQLETPFGPDVETACNTLLMNGFNILAYSDTLALLSFMKRFNIYLTESTSSYVRSQLLQRQLEERAAEGKAMIDDALELEKVSDIIRLSALATGKYNDRLQRFIDKLALKYNYDTEVIAAIMCAYTKPRDAEAYHRAQRAFEFFEERFPQNIHGTAVAHMFAAHFRHDNVVQAQELLQKYIANLNTIWKIKDAVIVLNALRAHAEVDGFIHKHYDKLRPEFLFLLPDSDRPMTLDERKLFVAYYRKLSQLLPKTKLNAPSKDKEIGSRRRRRTNLTFRVL